MYELAGNLSFPSLDLPWIGALLEGSDVPLSHKPPWSASAYADQDVTWATLACPDLQIGSPYVATGRSSTTHSL